MKKLALGFATVAILAAACSGGGKTDTKPASELGRQLFHEYSFSDSPFNRFSCATCHAEDAAGPAGQILAGFPLFDAANRPDWFDGNSKQFLEASNFCLQYFMQGAPMAPGDPDGDALYEYLASISPDAAPPAVSYTFVRVLTVVPPGGSATSGKAIYDLACRNCHGDKDNGNGRISTRATILNAQLSADYDTIFPGVPHDQIVTEKIRHGRFYGVSGNMPFFAVEKLSDSDLSDLEAYLNL